MIFRGTSPTQQSLDGGKRWYAYSGLKQGDVSLPSTIELINIPNTGLEDCYINIEPIFGTLVSSALGSSLGIEIKINGETVVTCDQFSVTNWGGSQLSTNQMLKYTLFVPKQSSLEVISLNTSNNNTQERGCNILGWYL